MRCDSLGKFGAEHAPCLVPLGPGLDLVNPDSFSRQKERRRQIQPKSIAVEIGAMQRIPGRRHLMACKSSARIVALGHDTAVTADDRNSVRGKLGVPIGIAKGLERSTLMVQFDGYAARIGILE